MEKEPYEVINNEKQMQFQVHSGEDIASLDYRFYKDDIALMHTVVPDALSGKGIASHMAKFALDWARLHNKKVKVYCSFVATFLKNTRSTTTLLIKFNVGHNRCG